MKTEKQVLDYLSKFNWTELELGKVIGYAVAKGIQEFEFSSPKEAPAGNFKQFMDWYECKFEVGDWVEMSSEARSDFAPFQVTNRAKCVLPNQTVDIYIGGSRWAFEYELQPYTPIPPFQVFFFGVA